MQLVANHRLVEDFIDSLDVQEVQPSHDIEAEKKYRKQCSKRNADSADPRDGAAVDLALVDLIDKAESEPDFYEYGCRNADKNKRNYERS